MRGGDVDGGRGRGRVDTACGSQTVLSAAASARRRQLVTLTSLCHEYHRSSCLSLRWNSPVDPNHHHPTTVPPPLPFDLPDSILDVHE